MTTYQITPGTRITFTDGQGTHFECTAVSGSIEIDRVGFSFGDGLSGVSSLITIREVPRDPRFPTYLERKLAERLAERGSGQ